MCQMIVLKVFATVFEILSGIFYFDQLKKIWFFWGLILSCPAALMLGYILIGLVLNKALIGDRYFLFALPFIDRSPHRHPRDRPLITAGLGLVLAVLLGLTLFGYLA